MNTSQTEVSMENRYYGALPEVIGEFPIIFEEICFYQYMPIKLIGNSAQVMIPERLEAFEDMIHVAYNDFRGPITSFAIDARDYYIYLTAKHVYVTPEYWGNRPGWHTDGFGTDDINYIWYDKNPTIFSNVPYQNISEDHELSMKEFENQRYSHRVRKITITDKTYPCNTLLKLDRFVVHKVAPVTESGFRTFVKITFSKNKYNLKGNTHNYLLNYKWEMKERGSSRNHPTK